VITTAQLHRIITTSRGRGGTFGWLIALILYITPKILYKVNQAVKQASKPNDFDQASQASKLKVPKIASQQAEGSQLGLLACYPLWL